MATKHEMQDNNKERGSYVPVLSYWLCTDLYARNQFLTGESEEAIVELDQPSTHLGWQDSTIEAHPQGNIELLFDAYVLKQDGVQ